METKHYDDYAFLPKLAILTNKKQSKWLLIFYFNENFQSKLLFKTCLLAKNLCKCKSFSEV